MPGLKKLAGNDLLDLGFFELDVLARNRIVFLEDHLVRERARIFLGHVKETGARSALELDLYGCRLSHRTPPWSGGRNLNFRHRMSSQSTGRGAPRHLNVTALIISVPRIIVGHGRVLGRQAASFQIGLQIVQDELRNRGKVERPGVLQRQPMQIQQQNTQHPR